MNNYRELRFALGVLTGLLFCIDIAWPQTAMGPIRTPQVNNNLYVGQSGQATIAATVANGCRATSTGAMVIILPGVNPPDMPSGQTAGCAKVFISDQRVSPPQFYRWSGNAYVAVPYPGGGAAIPETTNLISGNGTGGAVDSTIAAGVVCTTTNGLCANGGGGGNPGGTNGQLQFNRTGNFGGASQATYGAVQNAAGTMVPDTLSAKVSLKSNGIALNEGSLANRSDMVDVIADLGAKGAGNSINCTYNNKTGCQDDWAVINAFTSNTANAGKRVFFPKTTTGVSYCDYFFSQPLRFAAEVSASGRGGMFVGSGTNLCFASGSAGVSLGGSQKFEDFLIYGNDYWDRADIRTFILSQRDGGTGPNADGLSVGGTSYISNISVMGFARDCVTVNTATNGGSDATTLMNIFASGCRGHGIANYGIDAQVGIRGNSFSRFNQLYGIYGAQMYSNIYLMGNTDYNHDYRAFSAAPGSNPAAQPGFTPLAGNITNIACVDATGPSLLPYTCTVTMDTQNYIYTNSMFNVGDFSANDFLSIQGTGTAIDGYGYKIRTAPNGNTGGATTFTFDYNNALTYTGGGTVSYNPGARVWAQANAHGGGWGQNYAGPSNLGIVIAPYMESTDWFANFNSNGSASLVIGGDGTCCAGYGGVQLTTKSRYLYTPQVTMSDGSPYLATYFGGYSEYFQNPATVFTGINQDYNHFNTYSQIHFRRMTPIVRNIVGNGNINGWWALNDGGSTAGISAATSASLAVSDQLTNTGRSTLDTARNNVWMPHGLFVGSSNGITGTTNTNPDCYWNTGSAPPNDSGTYRPCDTIFNVYSNGSNPAGWTCTLSAGCSGGSGWQATSSASGNVNSSSPWTLMAQVTALTPATTSNPIDTTGANLIVIAVTSVTTVPTVSDSYGNTWVLAQDNQYQTVSAIYYCINPIVGPNHTFTQGTATTPNMTVFAFKGAGINLTLGPNSNAVAVFQSQATLPAITPASNNSLIVSVVANNSVTPVVSVSGGLVMAAVMPNSLGNNTTSSSAAGYMVQSVAAPIGPTWTWGGLVYGTLVLATFNLVPAGSLTGGNPVYTVSTLPPCNAGGRNATLAVTDASGPTYLGTLTGGGSVYTPVVCNGTAWVAF